jgi:hypothetical protein
MKLRVAMKTKYWVIGAFLAIFFGSAIAGFAQMDDAPATPPPAANGADKIRTVAIFIKNRAKNVDDEKVSALEDLVTSRITDSGFHVLGREDVLNSVATFSSAGANAGDANAAGADLDKILSNNTSALRLAQNMNADYVLVCSITTYGQDVQDFNEGDVHTRVTESTMLVSYKLLDGVMGGSLTGDVITAKVKDMEQPGQTVHRDLVNKLLDQASTKLAAALDAKVRSHRIREGPAAQAKLVDLSIDCTMADLSIPEIVKNDNGDYAPTALRYKLDVMSCTVSLDGVTVGTTPGPFQVLPGLHKIRINRETFKDWEQTINIPRAGLHLDVALTMSPEGYARWQETIGFLQDVKDQAKFADANVKRIEGIAKMFSQSGFKVDVKSTSNTNVDIKKNVNIDAKSNGTSLWAAPAAPAPAAAPLR